MVTIKKEEYPIKDNGFEYLGKHYDCHYAIERDIKMIIQEAETSHKVKPKFKVGDIIRHKEQGFTCKIIAVDTEYILSGCNGNHLPFDSQNAYELVEQKSAWSEESAKAINRISEILVDASEVKNWWKEYRLIERDEMIRLTDFLKSLRPQSTWKPSDEQMATFWDAICTLNHDGYKWINDMKSLFQDLKKLKG